MFFTRVLLVPFLIVMMVFGTLVYFFYGNLRKQVTIELSRVAAEHGMLIEQFLEERASDLAFIVDNYNCNQLNNQTTLEVVFNKLQKKSNAFFDIGVFDENGNHTAYIGPFDLIGINYADTSWFRGVESKGVYISDVFSGYRKVPHFIIAVKKVDRGGTWYIRATIDTVFFNRFVEKVKVGKTGEAYLVNKFGKFQTNRRSGGELMNDDPDAQLYNAGGNGASSFYALSSSGEKYIYAVTMLKNTNWTLVVRQEKKEAYAPLYGAVIIAAGLIVAGGVVVVTMAFLLAAMLINKMKQADIDKKQMKTQLIAAGKLAELGEMSAAVAHEINNPLQIIRSEQTLLGDVLNDLKNECPPQAAENIALALDSINQVGIQIERCRNITQGLLKFARQSETTKQALDLKFVIEETIKLIERKIQVENIKITREIAPDLPYLMADPGHLQQLFFNLLNNAIDALEGKGSGEIRVCAFHDKNAIIISISDNGCGIPPENIEKMFLPFFTTKPVGHGTGLGLSTCYGIVENMGGEISVSSEVNVGTTFKLALPVVK